MPSPLKKLFKPEKAPLFPFIDGLRALSILWIISLHTLWMFGYHLDKQAFIELSTRPELSAFFQGHLAVDTFFVISGFLIGYYLFSEYKQHQSLNLKQFYLRRALRLLPAYFAVMVIVAFVYPHNLHTIWANVLYVNNFIPLQQQFMGWTWSLAIEEQFYTLFPCLLLLIGKTKRVLLILVLLFLLSFVIRFALSYAYQLQLPLPMHVVIDKEMTYHFFNVMYDKSYSRYGGLMVGVIAAYLIVYTRAIEFLKHHHTLRRSLWVISLLLLISYIFIPLAGLEASVIKTAYLLAGVRNIFSLAIGYLVLYSLSIGQKSWVVKALSSRFWYPIAQLSYSAYLLHLMIIALLAQYLYPTMSLDFLTLLGLILLMITSTLVLATMLYIWIEKPVLELRNYRFPRINEKQIKT
ncbi:MAG: acyltransferase family protein [Methylococcaceae bacterium]|nr:acyltransferase family protein [Methylococcaceae bacterium]